MNDVNDIIGFAGRERIAAEADRKLELFVSSDAGDDLIRHLGAAQFGTAGIRYRRLDVRAQLARLAAPLFVELRMDDRLAGSYALSLVPLMADGEDAVGVYRALLTVDDQFKRRGLGHWLVENTLEWIKDAVKVTGRPVVSWGCIESNNERSIRLLRTLGAMPIGRLESRLVYRQWPRARQEVEAVGPKDAGWFNAQRRKGLDDCSVILRDTGPGQLFCLRRSGDVLAAARADLTRLEMQTMGSAWDALYRHLLRHSAAARRRFDPDDFRYLRIADPVVMDGQGRAWRGFISSLLAHFDAHMAMFVLDPASRQYRTLADAGVFGRFGDVTRQSISVLGQAWHCSPDILARVARRPLGIGPLDL